MAADGRGNCCCRTSAETAVVNATDAPGLLGDCRVAVAMAAVGCGNCSGLQWVVMVGTMECATERKEPRHVLCQHPWHT